MSLALAKGLVYGGVPLIYEVYANQHWLIFSGLKFKLNLFPWNDYETMSK